MKKVLIILYYWPPAGGPGVQRWLKFVKYLPEFGITPIVFAPENANYPIQDTSLKNEVPKDIEIIKMPIQEPYKWAKLLSKQKTKQISSGIISKKKQTLTEKLLLWVRGNFFIPDARKSWVKPSVLYLKNYLAKNNVDCVITTGPPHSLHLIGLALKKELSVKWVTDFRDPWTQIGYHKHLKLTQWARKKHKALEEKVLQEADFVITTSFTTAEDFKEKTNAPVVTITNGYDEYNETKPPLSNRFTMAHIGSLLSERNPDALWQALSELCQENKLFQEHLEIQLIGTISDDVLATIKTYGLQANTSVINYQPHQKVRQLQQAAQVLLLLEIDREDTRGIIPGKLFEYMVAQRPIVAVGPVNWDVATIIKQTNTGSVFTYKDKDAIKAQVNELFTAYMDNKLKVNAIGLQQYSRRVLTQTLANYLKQL